MPAVKWRFYLERSGRQPTKRDEEIYSNPRDIMTAAAPMIRSKTFIPCPGRGES
jgi:hypothetical protein